MSGRARRALALLASGALAAVAALAAAPPADAASATTGAISVGNATMDAGGNSIATVTTSPAKDDPVATFLVSYSCRATAPGNSAASCTNVVVTIPDLATFPAGSVSTPTSLTAALEQNLGAGWTMTSSTIDGNLSLTIANPGPLAASTSSTFTIRVTPTVFTPSGTVLSLLPTMNADGWAAPATAPEPAEVTVTGTPRGTLRLDRGQKTVEGSTVTVPFTARVNYATATGLANPELAAGAEAVDISAGARVVFTLPAGSVLANADAFPNADYDDAARTLTFTLTGIDFVKPADTTGATWVPPTPILLRVPQTATTEPTYVLTVTATGTSISGADVTNTTFESFDGRYLPSALGFTKYGTGMIPGDYTAGGVSGTNDTVTVPTSGSAGGAWTSGAFALVPAWTNTVVTGDRIHLSDRFPALDRASADTASTRTSAGAAGTGTVYSSPTEPGTSAPAFLLTAVRGSEQFAGTVTLLLDSGDAYGPVALTAAAIPVPAAHAGHVVGIEADLIVTATAALGSAQLTLSGTASPLSLRPGDDHARLENTATIAWARPDGTPAATRTSTGNLLVQDVAYAVTGSVSETTPRVLGADGSRSNTRTPSKKTAAEVTLVGNHQLDYGDTTMLTALVVPDGSGLALASPTAIVSTLSGSYAFPAVTVTPLSGAGEGQTAYSTRVSPAGATATAAGPGRSTVQTTFSLSDSAIGIYTYQLWTVQPGNAVPITSCAAGGTLTADVHDLDGDGDAAEPACMTTAKLTILGDTQPGFQVSKSAQDATGQWIDGPGIANIGTAATFSQKLRFLNSGGQPLANAVMYDVLPFEGDTTTVYGQNGPTPRNSAFRTVLAGVTAPDGVAVAYSTSAHPCMPEENQAFPGRPQDGCDDDWSTQPPADLGTVRAMRFVHTVPLVAAGAFEVVIAQTMPASGVFYGKTVFNSVAGGARYGAVQLVPTESELSGVVAWPMDLPALPLTGGAGAWIYAVSGGSALLAAAVAVRVRRRLEPAAAPARSGVRPDTRTDVPPH